MFTIIPPNTDNIRMPNSLVWLTVGLVLAVVLAFYLLRSFAVWKLAKKQQLDKAFLAWIPLVWIYLACKLVGKSRIFGGTFEKFALLFTIIFTLAGLMKLAYEFFAYFPIVGNFLAGNEMFIFITDASVSGGIVKPTGYKEIVEGLGIYGKEGQFVDPYIRAGLNLKVFYYAGLILDLASKVITVSLYIQIFKKYWPQHFILASVLSFMGLFPVFAFVIRNKQPIDYNEYMRNRYRGYFANGNPYGGQYRNQPPKDVPPTPFEEFADKDEIDPGDPFAEFSNKNKED